MRKDNSPCGNTNQVLTRPPLPNTVRKNPKSSAIPVWQALTKLGKQAEVKQSELAERVGFSVRTIRKTLKDFAENNILEVDSFNGKGHGIRIKNLWLIGWEKILQKFSWKRGFSQEDHFLRTNYPASAGTKRLGRNPKDYNISIITPVGRTTKENKIKISAKSFEVETNLPSDTKISPSTPFWSAIMEPLRGKLSALTGPGSKVGEIIVRSFGDKLKGKPLSWLREKLKALRRNSRKLIDRISWVLKNQGENSAWSVAYCFLVKGDIPEDKREKAKQELDGRKYDQLKRERKREARKQYDALREAGRKVKRKARNAETVLQRILSGETGKQVSELVNPSPELVQGKAGFEVLIERKGKLQARRLVRRNLKRYGPRKTLSDLKKFAEG